MNKNPTANKILPGAHAYNLLHATHVIGYVRDVLRANDPGNEDIESGKLKLLQTCRELIKEFGAGDTDADFYYEPNDWEFTTPYLKGLRDELMAEPDGVLEVGTLYNGPAIYYTEVPTQYDDLGAATAWEFMAFKTLEEATAAKNKGL